MREPSGMLLRSALIIATLCSNVIAANPAEDDLAPPQVSLRLVQRTVFTRNPDAGQPSEASILSRKLDIHCDAGVQPIQVLSDRVVFLAADGSIVREILLNSDPNQMVTAAISAAGRAVCLKREFSVESGQVDDSYEGGTYEGSFEIYGATGQLLFSTAAKDDFVPTVADNGALLLVNHNTPHVAFATPSHPQPRDLELPGSAPILNLIGTIANSGQRILLAGIRSLGSSVGYDRAKPADYIKSGVTEPWVAVFASDGRPVWNAKINMPRLATFVVAGLSDDGMQAVVASTRYDPDAAVNLMHTNGPVLLLAADGTYVERPEWGPASLGITYSSELKRFLLGFPERPTAAVFAEVSSSGVLRRPSAIRRSTKVQSRAVGAARIAEIVKIALRLYLVLYTSDGALLLARNISGKQDDTSQESQVHVCLSHDGRYVSVRTADELRVYEISSLGKPSKSNN